MRVALASPRAKIVHRLVRRCRVDLTEAVVAANRVQNLDVDDVWSGGLNVIVDVSADHLGATSTYDHLEQARRVNDQHQATARDARRTRR